MTRESLIELSRGLIGGVIGGALVVMALVVLPVPPEPAPASEADAPTAAAVAVTDVSGVVEKANPSVVAIVIRRDVPVFETYLEDPFARFFGSGSPFRVPRQRAVGTESVEVGGGSGFIIDESGLILTNKHVVADEGAEYSAFTIDGEEHRVKVLARDDALDLALLGIEGGGEWPALSFGDSSQLKLGQGVIAIGNALAEFRNSVSVGVVSGLSRTVVAADQNGNEEQLLNVIQTDAAINPGNSGGPLLSHEGKAVGINVAVAQGSENIGFAIPSNAVIDAVARMRAIAGAPRPFLGVRLAELGPEDREKLKLGFDHGVVVAPGPGEGDVAVTAGSPADKAGIRRGDIVLEMDGEKIDGERTLPALLSQKQPGDQVILTVYRDGEVIIYRVELDRTSGT